MLWKKSNEIVLLSYMSKKNSLKNIISIEIKEKLYKFKIFIYKYTNKIKYKKYKNKLYNIYYKRLNKSGHLGILYSLFRGFEKLNIKYSINKINRMAKNAIVIWGEEKDFRYIEKLKQKGKIKKIVTNPECILHTNEYRYELAKESYIDRVLVASDWVVNFYKKMGNINYTNNKIISWPSGVEVSDVKPETKINNSCIVYLKRVADEKSKVDDLISFIETLGIKCYIIEYPKYDFNYWQELLPNVDFVIFYQDYHETQGLAIAEAWAKNKPSFVKNTVNGNGEITQNAPYLTPYTGLSWNNIEELKSIIWEYKQNPEEFLSNFKPYDWTKENMSDEVSVKMLLDIFNSIGVNNE